MFVKILRIDNLWCWVVWHELGCVLMQCGAACGQGLWTQRSMWMRFLLSAPSLHYATASAQRRVLKYFTVHFFLQILLVNYFFMYNNGYRSHYNYKM